MKRFVIYTVITGEYEKVLQPKVVDKRFDYILFTDNKSSKKEGVWTVRNITIENNLDKIRLSRFPKTHPVSLLSDYYASLYIDANIQIQDEWIYLRIVELVEKGIEYAGVKLILTGRDCIYDHAFDMCVVNAEHDYTAIKQCHELYLRGFPPHFGLNENNLIFRVHNDSIRKLGEEWWYWIMNYSCRDQFSFMYCLWKYNIHLNYLLPVGEDSRNSNHFIYVVHNNNPIVAKRKWKKKGVFEKVRLITLSFNVNKGLIIWRNSYKSKYPVYTLYYLSLFEFFKSLPLMFSHWAKRKINNR